MTRIILNAADGRLDRKAGDYYNLHFPWDDSSLSGVRIGADTCSRELDFQNPDAVAKQISEIHDAGLEAWFTFPNVSQSQWDKAMSLLDVCRREGADGIVADDFGILYEAGGYKLRKVLGRQFDKRLRDPRIGAGWSQEDILEAPGLMTKAYRELTERENLYAVELEGFGDVRDLPEDGRFWIHAPYILISLGRFCEFSGINLPKEERYRIGNCRHQCLRIEGTGSSPVFDGNIYHRKNALYMMGRKAFFTDELRNRDNVEIVYTPVISPGGGSV